jgi:hypothetical protein
MSDTKKKILKGYKQIGKRFIPPMMTLGVFNEVSWINEILPELIWFGFLNEKFGVRKGIDLGCKISKEAAEIFDKKEPNNFSFLSSYKFLSEAQKNDVIESLAKNNILESLRYGLNTFYDLFPNFPLKFLFSESPRKVTEYDISDFKEFIAPYFDRRNKPAMLIQANAEYILAICGRVFYSEQVGAPDLELIVKRFGSDEEKKASSHVRAYVNFYYGSQKELLTNQWSKYFWDRCFQMEPLILELPVLNEEELNELGDFEQSLIKYMHLLDCGYIERFNKIPKDLSKSENFEIICALLTRQVSIGKRLARNPDILDYHVGTILLRALIDNHITIAWILKDYEDRIRKYILYGLGQEKLYLEHLENVKDEDDDNKDVSKIIDANENWINGQRYSFLTEINVGSWSGLSTREMAEQADCSDLYKFAYTPFSASTHSMWNHVGKYNVTYSDNPLHKYCLIPHDYEMEPRVDILLNSAKYIHKSFSAFDEHFKITCETQSPYNYWLEKIKSKTVNNSHDEA